MSTEFGNTGGGDASPREEATLLIPWYVNGTLEGEELALVERFIADSPDFAAEVERERRVARAVGELDATEEAALESWRQLEARLGADEPAVETPRRTPEAGFFGMLLVRVQSMFADIPSLFATPYPALGAAAVAVIAALLLMQGPTAPVGEEPSFQTLTSEPQLSGPRLRIKAAEAMDQAAVEALAAEHGLDVIDGPSASGIYTMAGGALPALETAAEAISAAPGILFVTVRGE
ncbi:MAG: hypothetical protein AAFP17_02440 [Pseudomonadota bacterium]